MPSIKSKAKRTRRNQAEIIQRIVESASELFLKRGFAATTTITIAQKAEVSERLIFEYFGSKQGLFDHIVYTPFTQLADQVLTDLEEEHSPAQLEQRGQEVLVRFLQRLSENRHLMSVLAVRGPLNLNDKRIAEQVAEMRRNYERAARRLAKLKKRPRSGSLDDVSAGLLVRLLFGMVVGSVLFSDWLFPEGEPTAETLATAVRRIIRGVTR
jgi:AcrR family transcriptional regulator